MTRRALACLVACMSTAGAVAADPPLLDERRARIFQQTCARCHLRPAIPAPRLGDTAAWTQLRRQGFETLVVHTVEGFGSMPPLGTCGACSEEDLRRLVAFLAGYEALPGVVGDPDE
jgi:cytochrome c5